MPPVPPYFLQKAASAAMPPPAGSPPPIYRHTRATECARLMDASKRRGSWRSHVHCTYTAQRVQLFKRQSRNVSLSLGDIKGVFSFAKENTPFDKAAPIQTSILTPCVSKVMMHPAMVTPSRMTGTARFRRISSTAAMSAPVHAPVPGSGMATKSSSPHVW